jgi:hypothetical protein
MGVHASKCCSRLEVQPLFHSVRLLRGLSSYVFAGIASKRPVFTAMSDDFFKIPSKARMQTLICRHIAAILSGHL